jgi:DNA mismatch endonuclease (patch repair protein)
MADLLTPAQRSNVMSRIRDRHTKPELILRSALHRLGFRYTLDNRKLPGKPDIVLMKYQTAIFVHGCFWHCHPGCKNSSIPRTNEAYWREKLANNVERDGKNIELLKSLDWKVLVAWECELHKDTIATVEKIVDGICGGGRARKRSGIDPRKIDRLQLLRNAGRKNRERIDALQQNKNQNGSRHMAATIKSKKRNMASRDDIDQPFHRPV